MESKPLTFEIPLYRWEAVQKRLNSIVKRAQKKGLTDFSYQVNPDRIKKTYSKKVRCNPLDGDEIGQTWKTVDCDLECVVVTISCPKPSINGWHFVGRIEHLADDKGENLNVVYSAPGEEVPGHFHTKPPLCEHCQINRYRKDTFIVCKETEHKQVGSTCLSDFLGIDAAAMLAYAEIIESAQSCCGDFEIDFEEYGAKASRCFSIGQVLEPAAAITMNAGYVSRRIAEERQVYSTADLVSDYLNAENNKERDKMIPPAWWNERVDAIITETTAWLADLAAADLADLNDYERNLAVVAKVGYCPRRAVGILGSACYSLMRRKEKEAAAQAAQVSQYQGAIGQRITRSVTVLMERPYSGNYGDNGAIYKFVDENGNRYLWFSTSKIADWTVGMTLTIVGTVKKHEQDRYEGNCNVTVLNRVKKIV